MFIRMEILFLYLILIAVPTYGAPPPRAKHCQTNSEPPTEVVYKLEVCETMANTDLLQCPVECILEDWLTQDSWIDSSKFATNLVPEERFKETRSFIMRTVDECQEEVQSNIEKKGKCNNLEEALSCIIGKVAAECMTDEELVEFERMASEAGGEEEE